MNLKHFFKKAIELLEGGTAGEINEEAVDPHELEMGIEEELEHTDNVEIAKEIALDHLAEDPQYYTKLKKIFSFLKIKAHTITFNDMVINYEVKEEIDSTDTENPFKYYIDFKENPSLNFEISTDKRLTEEEQTDLIIDYLDSFKHLIKSAVKDKYIPIDQTDWNYKDVRTDTKDYYDKSGQSLDKPKPEGETSMPVNEINKKKYPSTGWTTDSRGSSEPSSTYMDDPYSKTPEGDLHPDWPTESKFSYLSKEELFNFLKICKKFNISKELTRNAALHKYIPFFIKNGIYYKILDSYLDILYPFITPKLDINNDNIEKFIDDLYMKGYNKSTIKKEAYKEFEKEVLLNSDVRRDIKKYIKYKFSPRLIIASDLRPYLKIKHLLRPEKEGVILDVIEDSPEEAKVYVYWLDDNSLDFAKEEEMVIVGEPTFEEMKLVTGLEKAGVLRIKKNSFNYYLGDLLRIFKTFPISYNDFNEWQKEIKNASIVNKIKEFLIESKLLVKGKEIVYMADDKTVKTITVEEDETPPEEVKDEGGKSYKKVGEKE